MDAALRLAREIFPAVRVRVPEARLWLVGNRPLPEVMGLSQRQHSCHRACAICTTVSGAGGGIRQSVGGWGRALKTRC
ncbi:MAG: hypothetical protein R3E39_11090 [Anaerolineae bacterium]